MKNNQNQVRSQFKLNFGLEKQLMLGFYWILVYLIRVGVLLGFASHPVKLRIDLSSY